MSNAFSLIRGGRRSLVHSGPPTLDYFAAISFRICRDPDGDRSNLHNGFELFSCPAYAAKPNSLVYLAGAPTGFTSPQSGLLKTDDDAVVHSMDLVFGPAWMEPIK